MDTEREGAAIEMTQQEADEKNTAENREDSIRREYGFAPDVKLKECRFCCVMIPKKAKVCPNCRMSLKRHWFRNLVAAVFAIAVIGVGGYYLSAHWGIMKDAAASVWMAQKQSALPVMSVTTVDNKELAASGTAVEPSEVTNLSEAESESVPDGAEHQEDAGEQTEGAKTETADAKKTTAVESKPDAKSAEDEQAKETAGTETAEDEQAKETDGTDSQTDVESTTEADMQTDLAKKERSQVTMAKQDSALSGEEDEGGTDVPAKKMDRQEQKFREECTLIGYKSILRNIERYLDTALMVEVQVICQVDGGLFDDNTYYLCKTEDDNNIARYYVVRDDRETDDTLILEGDMLTVYGQLFGTCEIPADLVETMPTVPAISMLYYDLTGE